jgi:hypothetical protein
MQCRALIRVARRVKRKHVLGCVGAACAVLLLTTPALAASSGQRLWVSTCRPASGGVAFADVAAGARGEAYVAGSKRVEQSTALVLLKYDGDGRRAWAHAFRGDYRLTAAGAVGLDARGNVYVGGDVYWRNGESGILLVKYAPDGTRRWSRTWNPMHGTAEWNVDILASMAVDRAGNVYLAALSNIGWSDPGDGLAIPGLVLAKYDARGRRLWAVRYRDPADPTVLGTIPEDIALDGRGDVYVACAGSFFRDFDGTRSTASTLKFSGADGSLLASAVYNAARDMTARAVAVRGSTVAVCGEGFVVNYDLSLKQRYAVQSFADGVDVALDPAGNTLVTGTKTLGFSPDGKLLWQQAVDADWLRVDASGNSYVGGPIRQLADSGATGWTQGLVVNKYDGNGNPVWTQSWPDEPGWASPSCFTLGPDGVYIGGGTGRHGRAMLIKYGR